MSSPAVVLVHGSMHGSWCWDRVVPHLDQLGVRALAVDLPGRGTSTDRPISMSSSVTTIGDAIRGLGGPATVCAHSSGGVPAWLAAADNSLARQLVLVAALVPRDDDAPAQVMATVGQRLVVDSSGLSLRRDHAAELFYSDCSDKTIEWACDRLIAEPLPSDPTDDPAAAHSEEAWQLVAAETTYVICTEDRVLSPRCQLRLAAKMAASVELPSGHSPFLSDPRRFAEVLARIASR